MISGGGDSALECKNFFAEKYALSVKLIHRSDNFRAHNDSVQKALDYSKKGKLDMILNAEVNNLDKKSGLLVMGVESKNNTTKINKCDHWLPLLDFLQKIVQLVVGV